MKQYGLIGYPLTHSFSKKYFEEKFLREHITGCGYHLYPLQNIEELPALLTAEQPLGLNVTIPYKQQVIPFLNRLDAGAAAIGAVNCIKIANGFTTGYNTDAAGFQKSLEGFLSNKPDITFVLGTGGSSRAVCFVLGKIGLPYIQVSRRAQGTIINYAAIQQHLEACNLFINTTPLGMFPDITGAPAIPYHLLKPADYLFDLVYNPAETLFLKQGSARGAKTQNGLEMLSMQAEESWKIWRQ